MASSPDYSSILNRIEAKLTRAASLSVDKSQNTPQNRSQVYEDKKDAKMNVSFDRGFASSATQENEKKKKQKEIQGRWEKTFSEYSQSRNYGYDAAPERAKLLSEERMFKENATAQSMLQCILPVVMEHVRVSWSQFRKEMMQELRREAILCANVKVQDCLEEVRRVQNMMSSEQEKLGKRLEAALEELVTKV